ncbi:MAG: hypothetical protein NVSMB49_28220 [Ktedonobacteraceae bacterium]
MKFRRLFSLTLFVVLLAVLLGLCRMPVAHAASASTATLNGTYVTVQGNRIIKKLTSHRL